MSQEEVVQAALGHAIKVLQDLAPTLYHRPAHQRRAVLEAAAGMVMDLRAAGVLTVPDDAARLHDALRDQMTIPMSPVDTAILDAYETGEDRPT